ncbi:MAG: DUF4861 family protein [Kiritimatiellae bacterium]|nr:DUF4861 family protein [Kiritimatiellia bacterium]
MKKLMTLTLLVASALFAQAATESADEAALKAQLPSIFSRAAEQYRGLVKQMEGKENCFPKRWQNDQLVTIKPQDWCSGFFPGSLWYLYEFTKAEDLKAAAEKFTAIQDQIRHYSGNHDIGFMLMTSVGNALRLAPKPEYKGILLDGAEALSKRYNEKLGLIRSWGKIGEQKDFLVIVDNMMNLELLEWAAKNGGDAKFDAIAKSHADMTDRHHFRADNSAFHILNYDQKTGKINQYRAGQGASADGTWGRGHAWGLYGFTMMYRETKNPAYLTRALKCADYMLSAPNLPADGVLFWDYKAPNIPNEERDTSAAAITASALLELSGFAPSAKGAVYRAFAVKQLLSLASPDYFAKVGENGNFLLMHGVGHKPGNSEVDVPLNYGDYYFLEALIRFSKLAPFPEAAVDCGYAPYRMDDFYWENDHWGMRAYGPVIMEPAPKGQGLVSSGFDLFNKCVPYPVLEQWLHGSEGSYHKNHGKGMDNYKVATGRGVGGIGALSSNGWFHEKNWKAQRIISKTATKAVFELDYETYTVRGTVTTGTPFMRFDVTPKGDQPARMIGPGLDISAKRQHNGILKVDLENGFIANFEPDGVDGKDNGSILSAILFKGDKSKMQIASDNEGCIYLLQPSATFTYWIGAGWTGAGRFQTPEEWFACVQAFAAE